jgi:hypothetical protein
MIRRIFDAFRLAIRRVRMEDHIAHKRYDRAQQDLELLRPQRANMTPQFDIFLSLVLLRLEQYQDALNALEMARDSIELKMKESPHERNYLHCYCDRITYHVRLGLGQSASNSEFYGDFTAIDQSRVSRETIESFPLGLLGVSPSHEAA